MPDPSHGTGGAPGSAGYDATVLPRWSACLAAGILAWAASRAVLCAVMAGSLALRGRPASIVGMWVQWDAGYYLTIASQGYRLPTLATGDETGESTLNFFPLLPLGIRLLAGLLDHPVTPSIGLALTNACLIVAGVMLYRLAFLRLGARAARFALVSLMVLPGTFVASGVMTEAPFLALSISAAYLSVRAPWGAGGCLSLLAIDRISGIFQAFGLGLDWLRARVAGEIVRWEAALPLFLVPIPLLVYFADMYRLTGDALVVVHSHASFWHQRSGLPFQNVLALFWSGQVRLRIQSAIALPMLGVLVLAWRRFSLGEWLFVVTSLEVCTSGLSLAPSLIRYLIGLYPLHLAFGWIAAQRRWGVALLAAMAVVDALLAMSWAHGSDLLQ